MPTSTTAPHRPRRTIGPARRIVGALAVLGLLLVPGAPAVADGVADAVAAARGSALPVHPEADALAQRSAARIAAAGTLSHADLSPLLGTCGQAGEVVGFGPSVTAIFDRFLASPDHRRIVLASGWRSIGTGTATSADGRLFVSVVFCAAPAPAAAPAPTQPTSPPTDTGAAGPSHDDHRTSGVSDVEDLRRSQRHLSEQLGMSFEAFLEWLTEGPPPFAD